MTLCVDQLAMPIMCLIVTMQPITGTYICTMQSTIYIKLELLCGEAGSEVERNFSPALASRHVYLEGAVPSIPRAGH